MAASSAEEIDQSRPWTLDPAAVPTIGDQEAKETPHRRPSTNRPAQAKARLQREAARAAKGAAGLEELARWIGDLMRAGLATLGSRPESIWAEQARRLIDAQCPGVARRVAQIAALPRAGDGWQVALLDRLGQLHLLIEGFRRRHDLPEAVVADLGVALGWPVDLAAVRAGTLGTTVRDAWQVLGQIFEVEDRLQIRRVLLQGATSGRPACLIDFAAPGRLFEAGLEVGTTVDATLGFLPSAAPLRAIVVRQHGPPAPPESLGPARSIAAAQAELGARIAQCPWVDLMPVVLAQITIQPSDDGWHAVDPTGAWLPLAPQFTRGWHILARSGGAPITLAGELHGTTLRPTGLMVGGSFLNLTDPDPPARAGATVVGLGGWSTPATPLLRDLATVALLGTDRREVSTLEPSDPLEPVATGTRDRDAPSRLLALAAAASLQARVGCRSRLGPVPSGDPAPESDRPACSTGAADCLCRLLAHEFGPVTGDADLCLEWLTACDQAGQRVPDALIVSLLIEFEGLALVPELGPVLGARGQWLARRHPKWHRYGAPPDPEAAATAWATGTRAERLDLFSVLRRTDPAAARDLASSTFTTDPASFRAEVIAALRVGLTMADESMLEAALDDRSREVRAAAAALLVHLPNSRLVERMTARARSALAWDGDRLRVTPPAEVDASSLRDGLLANLKPAGWLSVIVAAVPPDRIAAHLSQPPATILRAAATTEFGSVLLLAFEGATIQFRDSEWGLDLVAVGSPLGAQRSGQRLADLLRILEPAGREALIRYHLRADPELVNPQSVVWALLDAPGVAIDRDLGREVAQRLGATISAVLADWQAANPNERFQLVGRPASLDPALIGRWEDLIPRLPVELVDELAPRLHLAMMRPTHHRLARILKARITAALDRWAFRRAMQQEFAPDELRR